MKPALSVAELAMQVGEPRHVIASVLEDLAEQGYVERGDDGTWSATAHANHADLSMFADDPNELY